MFQPVSQGNSGQAGRKEIGRGVSVSNALFVLASLHQPTPVRHQRKASVCFL